MSPIGEAFRRRCRMFPSLVNCCTIDWFESWPPEALYSVALGLFEGVIEDQKERESLAKTSVYIHKVRRTKHVQEWRFWNNKKISFYLLEQKIKTFIPVSMCRHSIVSIYSLQTVEEAALTYYAEMRRRYYTTPSSYLELLKLYKSLLKKRTDIIIAKRERLANGLNKILETNDVVSIIKVSIRKDTITRLGLKFR